MMLKLPDKPGSMKSKKQIKLIHKGHQGNGKTLVVR